MPTDPRLTALRAAVQDFRRRSGQPLAGVTAVNPDKDRSLSGKARRKARKAAQRCGDTTCTDDHGSTR